MCFCVVVGVIDGSSIHNINGERLTWDPPESPQGMITHYEVLVNGSIFTTPTNEIDISSFGLPPGVHFVQVCNVVCVSLHMHPHAYTYGHIHMCRHTNASTCTHAHTHTSVNCIFMLLCCFAAAGEGCYQCRTRKLFRIF